MLVETWPGSALAPPPRRWLEAIAAWTSARLAALVAGSAILVAVGYVHAVDLAGWPTLGNDDEGTYMARAWAVLTGRGAHHSLANYTYWYDHAPFGWMQLVPWAWLTGTYHAGTTATVEGRQMMVGYAVVATLLVYVVARRLAASRPAALVAMALFGLSPIAVDYTRQVFLDTIGMPWMLAALALALSPGRRLWAFAASGACFAAAVLSKETYLLEAPALLFAIWQRADGPMRRMALGVFATAAGALMFLWPLYAALKGELLPGPGHVSLIGAIEWQLGQRSGSGSVLRSGSGANAKVLGWYHTDPWLLGGGLVALAPAAAVRRLRPLATALVVPVLYVLRGGYIPAMYVEGVLPVMALLVACGADQVVRGLRLERAARAARTGARPRAWSVPLLAWRVVAVAGLGALVSQVAPAWAASDRQAMSYRVNTALFQAERYVEHHVPRTATLLVDANVWIDLVDDGYQPKRVVWFWELNTDPDVERLYPGRWRQMDYVVATNTLRVNILRNAKGVEPVVLALAHSVPMARFGVGTNFVTVYRVRPDRPVHAPWWLPGYGSMTPPKFGPDKGQAL